MPTAPRSTVDVPSRKRRRTEVGILKSEDRKPEQEERSLHPYDSLDRYQVVEEVESDVKPETRRIKVEAKMRTRGSCTLDTEQDRGRVPLPRRLEVVVPTLQAVRRRWQATADIATARTRQLSVFSAGLPPIGDSNDRPDHANSVKAEPTEDEQESRSLESVALPRSLDDTDPQRLRTAIEELRNPDVKVKKELLLSDEFLLDALTWEGINYRFPIPVSPEIPKQGFSRPYISHLYGGSLRATFPSPSPDMLEWHGLDDWAFLNLDYCPHAPTRPGYSGLHFSPHRARGTWEKLRAPLRTFVKLASSRWVYMGQYRLVPGKSLTTTAWMEQKPEVRKTWATGMLNKQWGSNVLLRVWFRKTKGVEYEPTEEDFADATVNIKDIRKAMTEQDIVDAYTRGEEEIGTYTMTCVGYDVPFVRVLEANAHRFMPSAQKNGSKGEKKIDANGSKGKVKSKTSGSKSKNSKSSRQAERSDERGEGSASEDVIEEEADTQSAMERRSTRARVKRVRKS